MALYAPGVGLLGTHVTWEDVEEQLKETFGPDVKLGTKKTITDIGDGTGFVSRIGIVDPDWQCEDNSRLPKRFVVKMVTLRTIVEYKEKINMEGDPEETLIQQQLIYKELHNKEVDIYRKLKKLNSAKVPILKIYGAVAFSDENPSKGFILMEAVDDITIIHADVVVDDKLIDTMLESIASFHALTWDFADEEKELHADILQGIFGVMLEKPMVTKVMPLYRSFLGDDSAAKLIDDLETATLEIGDMKYRRLLDNTSERIGMRRMLIHGDFWSCNMLFTQNKTGEYALKSLIDFQTSHFGCVAHDMARMMCNMLTKEQRDNKQQYLNIYHRHLLRLIGDRQAPFTIEQLTVAVDLMIAPYGYMLSASTCALSAQIIASRDEADREKSRSILVDKVRGLIIDTLAQHELNKEAFAGLE